MKLFLLLATLVVMSSLATKAQPVSMVGGWRIESVYDKNLKSVHYTDTSLHTRSFVLSDTTRDARILSENKYPVDVLPNLMHGNTRLFIAYKNDTMVVDFIGGNDWVHATFCCLYHIDSLVIRPGYYRYKVFTTQRLKENTYSESFEYKLLEFSSIIERRIWKELD